MMDNSEIRDFVLPSAPAKTLWFEFLFDDDLVENHLSQRNADPTGPELIVQFLNNINSISPLVPVGPVVIPTHNGSGDAGNSNGTESMDSSETVSESAQQKCFFLKLLAVKIWAYFNFDLDLIETKLPIAMQYKMVETLRQYTASIAIPPSLKIFGEILYCRWAIRCLTKSTLPTRSVRGLQIPIPLQQQIDPSFTPYEVTDAVMKNIYKDLVGILEMVEGILANKNLSKEGQVTIPSVKCFSVKKGNHFDWSKCESTDGLSLEYSVNFELGRFYFIQNPPNYHKAYTFFASIPSSHHSEFVNLQGYLEASKGMIEDDVQPEGLSTQIKSESCLESIQDPYSCPFDLSWYRCRAEQSFAINDYVECFKQYLTMLSLMTNYFTTFRRTREEDQVIQKLIQLSSKLSCHTQSAVLQQMLVEPNYALAFKSLQERACFDACDEMIDCIWDVTLLEFLVNHYTRRGDLDRKTRAVKLIGQLELNSNNHKDILKDASNVRKTKFFKILAKVFL